METLEIINIFYYLNHYWFIGYPILIGLMIYIMYYLPKK